MYSQAAHKKTAKHKKISHGRVSNQPLVGFFTDNSSEEKEDTFWPQQKLLQLIKLLLLPSLTICFDVDQFELQHVSVLNNKSFNTQSSTKQEIPEY